MKKILSVLLAVMMLMSCLPVMAEEGTTFARPNWPGVTPKPTATTKPIVTPAPTAATTPAPKIYEDGPHWAYEDDAVTELIPATCTEAAHQDFKCQVKDCDAVFTVYFGEKNGHKPAIHTSGEFAGQEISEVVTPARCEIAGEKKLHCTVCDKDYTVAIPALEHAWSEVKAEAFVGTCTEDAYKVRACSNANCPIGKEKYDIVKAPGHNFTVPVVVIDEVNCDEDGLQSIFKACSHNSAWNNEHGVKYAWNCEARSDVAESSITLEKDVVRKMHQDALVAFVTPNANETNYEMAKRIAGMTNDKGIVTVATDVVYPGTNYAGEQYKMTFTAEVEYVKPTCTTAGYMSLSCTSETGECFVKFDIEALGHDYTTRHNDKAQPTCLTNGSVIVTCANGCDFIEQIEIAAPGTHNHTSDACFVVIKQKVEVEGKAPVEITIPSKNYTKNPEFIAKIAECADYTVETVCCGYAHIIKLSNGDSFSYVIRCNKLSDAVTVKGDEKHIADQNKFAYEAATCTTDGWKISYCTECGAITTVTVKAMNHIYPNTEKYANVAGESAYRIANYETDVVEATCTTAGSKTLTCELCEDVIVVETPATGHTWDLEAAGKPAAVKTRKVVTKPMTCKAAGSETWYCGFCQETKVVEIAIKHTPAGNVAVKDATCLTAGSRVYTCGLCHEHIEEVIEAKGHTFEREGYNGTETYNGEKYDGYVDATCTTKGYYHRTCTDSMCDLKTAKGPYVEKVEVGELLNHKLVGYEVNVKGETVRVEANLIVTTLPTCCTAGEATYNCVACGKRDVVVLPALGHNEELQWNEKTYTYEFVCVPYVLDAKHTFADYMKAEGRNYLYEDILSRIDVKAENRKQEAASLQDKVIDQLSVKMIETVKEGNKWFPMFKDETIVRGVGCEQVVREIKVNKTHYDATVNADGTITIEAIENCALLENPRLIVSWAYTLSDGTSMTVTGNYGAVEYNEDNTEVTFVVNAPEVDWTTELVQTTIAVTTGYSTDLGAAYVAGYGWDVIEA